MASSTDKTAVDRYFLALNSMARDAYLACFSEDALVMDPYGGRPLQGVAGLHKFMDGMERTWSSFTMTPDAPLSLLTGLPFPGAVQPLLNLAKLLILPALMSLPSMKTA